VRAAGLKDALLDPFSRKQQDKGDKSGFWLSAQEAQKL